jgi:hypothetical protein
MAFIMLASPSNDSSVNEDTKIVIRYVLIKEEDVKTISRNKKSKNQVHER